MVLPDSSWIIQVSPRLPRFFLVLPGSSWIILDSSWFLLEPVGSFRIVQFSAASLRFFLVPPGSSWFLLVHSGSNSSGILLDYPGFWFFFGGGIVQFFKGSFRLLFVPPGFP